MEQKFITPTNQDPKASYLLGLGMAIANIVALTDKTRYSDQNVYAQNMINDIHKKAMEVIGTQNPDSPKKEA